LHDRKQYAQGALSKNKTDGDVLKVAFLEYVPLASVQMTSPEEVSFASPITTLLNFSAVFNSAIRPIKFDRAFYPVSGSLSALISNPNQFSLGCQRYDSPAKMPPVR